MIELTDPDGTVKEIAIPMHQLASGKGGCLPLLGRLGLIMADSGTTKAKLLLEYLTNSTTEHRILCVQQPGWHGPRYVLGDRVFTTLADDSEKVVLQKAHGFTSNVGLAGSLSDWQESIGQYLAKNTRLALATCTAFAAPFLEVVKEPDSGGFHFFGGSSIGKTTALRVGGSVWGGGRNGYLHSWRATDNGLEYLAEAHNDALFCLDEMGQADSRTAGEVAYMLANGQGKTRSTADGGLQAVPTWQMFFLSSGEVTLADKMRENGQSARAGQETRLIDIPADAGAGLGLFDDIHGFSSPSGFAQHLTLESERHFGTPIVSFLDRLTSEMRKDRSGLVEKIRSMRDRFQADNVPAEADGQVDRVSRRFSLVAAAGELAVEWDIVPAEPGLMTEAISKCMSDWIDNRGGTGAGEDAKIIAQVRLFIEGNQMSRIARPGESGSPQVVHNLAGYHKTFTGGAHQDQSVFALLPTVFKHEVCSGFDIRLVVDVLKRGGYLITGTDGRPDMKIRVDGRPIRCYCVSDSILEGAADDEPTIEEEFDPYDF